MFAMESNIKIGHRIEKAYDVQGHTPFTMMSVPPVKDTIMIVTDYDNIIVTDDTYVLTARGKWKMVCDLQQGELLKTVSCNAKILRFIESDEPHDMYYVSNTDYIIVNGFYIDG